MHGGQEKHKSLQTHIVNKETSLKISVSRFRLISSQEDCVRNSSKVMVVATVLDLQILLTPGQYLKDAFVVP